MKKFVSILVISIVMVFTFSITAFAENDDVMKKLVSIPRQDFHGGELADVSSKKTDFTGYIIMNTYYGGSWSDYCTEEDYCVNYSIPANLFEAAALERYDITVAELRTNNHYDSEDNVYEFSFGACGDAPIYFVPYGYVALGDNTYEYYYTCKRMDSNDYKTPVPVNKKYGVDYIFTIGYENDTTVIHVQPLKEYNYAKQKLTVKFDGTKTKLISQEPVDSFPTSNVVYYDDTIKAYWLALRNWQDDSVMEWVYVNSDRTLSTGWDKINNKWYFFDSNGFMQTGWVKTADKWYYLKSSGEMATGWIKDGKNWYYLNSSGAMVTGWQKISNKWYYFASSGVMKSGWLKDGTNWYYLNPAKDSTMATGWLQISGKWYYFGSNGAMKSGWLQYNNKWYYLNPAKDSTMATGWLQISGKWYYFGSSGIMVTGTQTIGGKTYKFNSSGAWVG